MKWVKLILALIALILAIFVYWAGEWIIWDWAGSIVNGPWIDWSRFCNEWGFYAPLFLYRWDCHTWTGPFDLGKLWLDLGAFIMIVSSFCLGYFARPEIERLLRRFYSSRYQ